MRAIFTDIVNGAEQQVRDRIAQDPSVVGAVAAGTPKQYAGQSTLQVAVRSGEFAIAHFFYDAQSADRSKFGRANYDNWNLHIKWMPQYAR